MNRKTEKSGFTMVEMVIVILLIALLALAIFPLLKTSFDSWEIADRRTEVAQIGRVGMSKLTREIRKAWDLTDASGTNYIQFNPIWASSSEYRFEYATSQYKFNYGATSAGVFSSDTLSYPVDSFTWAPYSRRLSSASVTRYRRVNSIWAQLAVSDERRRLPAALDPRYLRSSVQMRIAREGYFIAKSTAYATQSYVFDKSNCDQICVRVFNDRIDPPMTATTINSASVTFDWGAATNRILTYNANGDYYATCCAVGDDNGGGGNDNCGQGACDLFADDLGGAPEFMQVIIALSDGSENMISYDQLEVQK